MFISKSEINKFEDLQNECEQRSILIKSHPDWEKTLEEAKKSGDTIEYIQAWMKRENVLRR